jgi:Tfp pilus assembly protein PilF
VRRSKYAHGGLGAVLTEQCNLDEAKQHLQKALAYDPSYEVAQQALKRIDELRETCKQSPPKQETPRQAR